MANTYLSRTQGTGNRQKFTLSTWFKTAKTNADQTFYGSFVNSSNYDYIFLNSSAQMNVNFRASGSNTAYITTNRKFKDVSAFYHVVVAVDTTQGTEADRIKIYINGVQETSFATATYPSVNTNTTFNNGGTVYVGSVDGSQQYFDGSLSHFHWVDGTAYPASTFGESDSVSGIWKPKTAPSVTYGTNGLFLKFENSGAMGTDSSGETNTFSPSGTLTQNVDTPSNNFATLNPLDVPYPAQQATFTNGNLTGQCTTSGFISGTSSFGVSAGKFYAEFKLADGNIGLSAIGVLTDPVDDLGTTAPHDSSKFYGARGQGSIYVAGTGTDSWADSWSTNDIIGLGLDLDNNRLYVSKNGQWADGSGNYDESNPNAYITLASNQTYFFMGSNITTGTGQYLKMQSNFGQGYFGTTVVASAGTAPSEGGIFEYNCPTGFQALCTKGINSF